MSASLASMTDWILDSLDSGVLILDLAGNMQLLNREGARLLGIDPERARGRSLLEVPRLQPFMLLVQDHRKEGPSQSHSRRRVPAEIEGALGQKIPVRTVVSNLVDGEGTVQGFVVVFRDVSEMMRLEARARWSEQLAALGTVAAGVVHEVRNPLHAIHSLMELVEGKAERGESLDEYVQMVYDEVAKLDRLMEDILSFSREVKLRPVVVDLAELLAKTAAVLNTPDDIALTVELEDGLPPVELDPDRLQQVLRNLVRNAIEAQPGGGSVVVGARRAGRRPLPSDERGAAIDFVELFVRDAGPGIDGEDLARVFEPFFTRRRKGVGSGLGLGICQKIVEAHDGFLEVESAPGEGSCFRVLLPRKIGAEAP